MRWAWAWVLLVAGCAGEAGDPIDEIVSLPGDATSGEALYGSTCAVCHGDSGEGASGPALSGEVSDERELATVIWYGEGDMAGYEGLLTEQDVADLIVYLKATFGSAGA